MRADIVSREELYVLVWSEPMIKVAEKFKVSGSYMARVCSTLHVPRPERGYWAKIAVGKAPEKPLPDAQPGDQLSWFQDGGLQSPPRPHVSAPSPRSARRQLTRVVTGVHGLIRDAKGHYDVGYKVDEGQHLRPHKRLLVDVTASQAGLDKALTFANDLFNAFESAGYRVLICSPAENFTRPRIEAHEQLSKARQERQDSYYHDRRWSPQRPTVVYIGSVAFGLAIIEMSESVALRYVNGKYIRESEYKPPKASARYFDHSWTTTKDIPCGRLRLVVYAPYRGVSWSISFDEGKDRAFTTEIPKIVKSIKHSTEALVEMVKAEERQAEIRHREWEEQKERWRKEEDQRRVAESIKQSREQLAGVIADWARVVSLEQFFSGVQSRAQELPEEQRQEVLKRLALAREFVGTQDPLDFFRSWKTPVERYMPLSMQQVAAHQERN